MAAGRLSVVTDVGDSAHVVGETQRASEFKGKKALVAAVGFAPGAITDVPTGAASCDAVRRRVETYFSPGWVVAAYFELWNKLLDC